MSTGSIAELEIKIDSHITNQEKINDRLVSAIDKLSDTVSKVDVYQAEANRLEESVRECREEYKELRGDMSAISTSVALNTKLSDDLQWIKRAVYGVVITAILGGGYFAKSGHDSSATQDKIMQQQAEVLSKIADKLDK